jgi:hypothetical protein
MFKTVSIKFAALALAATCALTAGITASEAKKNRVGRDIALVGTALVGGLILGEILKGPRRVRRVARDCWTEKRFLGEDEFGDAVFERVRVCAR